MGCRMIPVVLPVGFLLPLPVAIARAHQARMLPRVFSPYHTALDNPSGIAYCPGMSPAPAPPPASARTGPVRTAPDPSVAQREFFRQLSRALAECNPNSKQPRAALRKVKEHLLAAERQLPNAARNPDGSMPGSNGMGKPVVSIDDMGGVTAKEPRAHA